MFYHQDSLGSTVATSTLGGAMASDQRYDAFGVKMSYVDAYTPFGFAGQHQYQTDAESGLLLLGHRYYDPATGRFISQDPAQDDRNWYAYCANNPLVAVDPTGETEVPTSKTRKQEKLAKLESYKIQVLTLLEPAIKIAVKIGDNENAKKLLNAVEKIKKAVDVTSLVKDIKTALDSASIVHEMKIQFDKNDTGLDHWGSSNKAGIFGSQEVQRPARKSVQDAGRATSHAAKTVWKSYVSTGGISPAR